MSESQEPPWSNNPNAPKIPYSLYLEEKADFAGMLIASVLYGTLAVLFFQCMAALFNPINQRGAGVKWGLVSYTVTMFSIATVLTGMALNLESISHIDNREFPGVEGEFPPGPIGYQLSIWSGVLVIPPRLMFLLNNWLSDGLLLYRCYIIYSRSLWVIVFPCLMLLGSIVTGLLILIPQVVFDFSIPCVAISISLNVLLTLMIVIRLALHGRNVRAVSGSPAGIDGLYKAIATMLIESSALYTVNSLLLIGLWIANSGAADIFLPIVAETQVIAPLLIIKRVANKSALTSDTVATGHIGSFHARTRGGSTGGSALPGGYTIRSEDGRGRNSGELGLDIEATMDFHQDSKIEGSSGSDTF